MTIDLGETLRFGKFTHQPQCIRDNHADSWFKDKSFFFVTASRRH